MNPFDHLFALTEDIFDSEDVVKLTVLDPGETFGVVTADWHRDDRRLVVASASLSKDFMMMKMSEFLHIRSRGIFLCEEMPKIDPMHDSLIDVITALAATVCEVAITVNPSMWKPWYAANKKDPKRISRLHHFTIAHSALWSDRHQKDAVGMTIWYVANFLAHPSKGARSN